MFCEWPFEALFVDQNCFCTCCSAWLNFQYTIIRSRYPQLTNPWKIWNHQVFQELRQKMLDVEFSSCLLCPRYQSNDLIDNQRKPEHKIIMEHGPKRLVMADELQCNLQCWTCRPHKITDINKDVINVRNNILKEFLPTAELFSLLHSGEAFFSKYYRDLIYNYSWHKYPRLKVELFTNGTLLPYHWNKIPNFKKSLIRVLLSLDAGTGETYKISRGGNWNNVLESMRIVQENGIELWTNMTVTSDNYKDIPAFIEVSKKYGATRIEIKDFLQWWHSEEQWKNKAIQLEEHELHEDYLKVLAEATEKYPDVNLDHLRSNYIKKANQCPNH